MSAIPAEILAGAERKPHRTSGWWGMIATIATEAALFAYLLFSYGYIAAQAPPPWPPVGAPELKLALPNTLVLLASSVTVWWAERRLSRRGDLRGCRRGFLATLAFGAVFIAVQLLEWHKKSFTPASHVYGSLYFTITGFHMAHVVAGWVMLAAVAWWLASGRAGPARPVPVAVSAVYWHFVDAVWLAVFTTFYLLPRLG
ncbi:MAG: heme-copper oxidase subunit III [Gammaproteobacteria bacterium]|nr:heme-copper oxidase subunit III [Gammaproteobacteria bacterium]MBI5616573.1 heme-copper oxidase subunit III [Gammaproteobacteria bacterium]